MKVSGNLAWKNLTIEVNDRNKKSKILRILDNVSGEAKAGRMNIIMGPSGSGKSTLINTLMGVVPRNFRTSGRVLLDGKDRTMEYKMLVGTCDQDDVFYEHHTAEDFLKFHAKGANRHLSDEQNEERINFLLKRLRLEGRRNTKVAKLSGGEKKRLILISELMTDKKIIFLDEPTSGLDSHLALDLISFLKEITVEKNLMMFVTIHQPSPTIVRMFDDFTFLAWGRVLYHGEYVKCEEYFKENGFIKPENITFTEYLFELTTEKSCFDEIVPNLDKVQSLLPEKAESPKNSSKSFYILETKMSFKVIWALFMRLASHYFRNILSIGLILFILCTLGVNFFVFICSKKLKQSGSNTTNSNKSIGKNAIAENCLKLVVEMIFLSFSVIGQRIFSYSLKNNRLINIEIRNNIYSPFELLFSISILVICIYLFVIVFYNILFSMLSVTFYLKIFLLFLPFVFIFLVMGCLFYYNLNFSAGSFSILLFYFPMLKNVIFGIREKPYFKSLFSFDHEKYHAYLDFFSLFLAFFPQIAYTAFVSFKCNKFISQLEIFDYDAWKDKTLSNFFYRFIQVNDSYGDPGGVSKTTILASLIATILLLFLMVWNAFYVLKRKYSQSYRYVLENK